MAAGVTVAEINAIEKELKLKENLQPVKRPKLLYSSSTLSENDEKITVSGKSPQSVS